MSPMMFPMMQQQMMNGGMPFNPYSVQQNYMSPRTMQQKKDGSAYWICKTCNTHNFHNGSQCHGCGQAWICPICTFNNYSFRNECLRCKTPKPEFEFPDPATNSTSFVTMQTSAVQTPPQPTPDNSNENAI